jgi:hypothetical protein
VLSLITTEREFRNGVSAALESANTL